MSNCEDGKSETIAFDIGDPLAPSVGIVYGLLLSVPLWGMIVFLGRLIF